MITRCRTTGAWSCLIYGPPPLRYTQVRGTIDVDARPRRRGEADHRALLRRGSLAWAFCYGLAVVAMLALLGGWLEACIGWSVRRRQRRRRCRSTASSSTAFATSLNATGQNVPGRSAEQPTPTDVLPSRDVRFGLALTVDLGDTFAVEYFWARHDLDARVGDDGGPETRFQLDLRTTSYLGHVLYRLEPLRGDWEPFVFAGLGAAVVRTSSASERHLTYDAGGGLERPFGRRFGVRVQARLAPQPAASQPRTVQGRAGTGTYAVEAHDSAVRFEVSVGLTLAF